MDDEKKLWELLAGHTDEEIVGKVVELYPDQRKEGYSHVLEELRMLKPARTSQTIIIEHCKEDGEEWEHVSGYEKGRKWAIDLSPFERWLGCWVDIESVWRLGEVAFIAHCLWEMTYHGFSNKAVKGKFKEIVVRANEIYKLVKNKKKNEDFN